MLVAVRRAARRARRVGDRARRLHLLRPRGRPRGAGRGRRARRRRRPAGQPRRRSPPPAATSCWPRVRAAAERSPARACVQLDHVSDLELIGAAFELGAGAVMADGSRAAVRATTSTWSARRRRCADALRRRRRGRARPRRRRRGRRRGRPRRARSPTPTRRGGSSTPPASPASRSRSATSTAPTRGEPQLDWDRLGGDRGRGRRAALAARRLRPARRGRAAGGRRRRAQGQREHRAPRGLPGGDPRAGSTRRRDGGRVMDLHEAQTRAVRELVDGQARPPSRRRRR